MRHTYLFTAIGAALPLIALAADDRADAAHARSLAATCANCHTSSDALVPPLAGMSESAIARAMQDFKTGARQGTVMPQLAKGYTDAQINAIAAWYARAKR